MLQAIAKKSGVTPPALKDRPTITEAQFFYVSCFYEINLYRAVGENFQPLRLADIKAYIDLLGGFSTEDKIRFLKVIGKLDQAYISKRIEPKTTVQQDMTMA